MQIEPKIFIDTREELLSLLNEWQTRLWLSDWWIYPYFCDKEDMISKGMGQSDVEWVGKNGTIGILRKEDIPTNLIVKTPHELMLIHELLHFKFFLTEPTSENDFYFYTKQHQLLDELAKSLYMAKYNLDHSWFMKGE